MATQLSFAQSVDFDSIKYNGLDFYSTKSEIIKKFGQPKKSYDPNYDCGFLSTESQDGKYVTLDYEKVKFTGNKKEKYLIELVDFEKNASIILNYGKYELTCKTELSKLTEIFGQQLNKHFEKDQNGGIIIFRKNAEDGIRIEIKNGKLIRFEYWSPC